MSHKIECEGKSDQELIPLILSNGDFYLCLMKRYEARILSYIMRISGLAKEDAEDILQDVFIKAYTNLNDFDPELKFSSWIYRIAHNRTISNFRKIMARPQSEFSGESDRLMEKMADDADIIREMDIKLDGNKIREVLNGLDDKYREALILKFLEEKDYREISDILEKPIGTVGTLINRAKKKFKEEAVKKKIIF